MFTTEQTTMYRKLYNATYDNDAYKVVTAHYEAYLSKELANKAITLLILTCDERIQHPSYDIAAVIWHEHEIALRRLLWDNITDQSAWIEAINLTRAYLMRFSHAAYWAAQSKFTVTNADIEGLRFELSTVNFFARLTGWVRIELEGATVDIQLMKRSRLGRQRHLGDQLVFVSAELRTPQGKKIRDVGYVELIWPDGFTVQSS